MTNTTTYKTLGSCCPIFQQERWDNKVHVWKKKHFIKSSFPAIFYLPIPFLMNKGINKMISLATASNKIYPIKEEALMLFSYPGPFKTNVFMGVTDEVEGADNATFTGTFLSNVYEGDYKDTGKFINKMKTYVEEKGLRSKQFYVHYAYCPLCAKEAQKNYAVVFSEIEEL